MFAEYVARGLTPALEKHIVDAARTCGCDIDAWEETARSWAEVSRKELARVAESVADPESMQNCIRAWTIATACEVAASLDEAHERRKPHLSIASVEDIVESALLELADTCGSRQDLRMWQETDRDARTRRRELLRQALIYGLHHASAPNINALLKELLAGSAAEATRREHTPAATPPQSPCPPSPGGPLGGAAVAAAAPPDAAGATCQVPRAGGGGGEDEGSDNESMETCRITKDDEPPVTAARADGHSGKYDYGDEYDDPHRDAGGGHHGRARDEGKGAPANPRGGPAAATMPGGETAGPHKNADDRASSS